MNKYVRVCEGLSDKGELISLNDFIEGLPEFQSDTDQYSSVYYYNDKHLETFKKTGSIAGIKDVTTDKIVFDFDNKDNLALAKSDVLSLYKRLEGEGISKTETELYFSGGKGFTVVINSDRELTPESSAYLATEVFGKDLKTLDHTIYNASRILRIPNSRHPKSRLFKVQLDPDKLEGMSVQQILDKAKSPNGLKLSKPISINKELTPSKKKDNNKKSKEYNIKDIDWTKKPRHWKDYRWSLSQGYFDSGERHQALLILAASCRGLGYDEEQTYYLCKSALKKQSKLTGQDEFSKEELWDNIIKQSIFSDKWEGGQYSPDSNEWLKKYCIKNNFKWDKNEDKPTVNLDDMTFTFTDYAVNFEKNTIKTGLPSLDNNVMLLASTMVGLLGNPGSGKTSLSLEILKNNSLMDNNSVFFSMDMGLPIVYAKLIQNLKGYNLKQVMSIFQNNPKESNQLVEEVKNTYKNIGFNFKSGLTVSDMREVIKKHEDKTGKANKLVVIDYLECMASGNSDPTVGSGLIANQLKDLANELNTCVLLLLQTQKHSTPSISDPLLSMRQVKGSSVLEQALSVILTLWREGYDPRTVNHDKYMSMACVKNRFGSLWTGDFSWDGRRGHIGELSSMEKEALGEFRQMREEQREENNRQWD